MSDKEGYVLTTEDCVGLAGIRSTMGMLADFSRQIGSATGAQDLDNKVQWLDGFMDRIGATGTLARMERDAGAFHIPEPQKPS